MYKCRDFFGSTVFGYIYDATELTFPPPPCYGMSHFVEGGDLLLNV